MYPAVFNNTLAQSWVIGACPAGILLVQAAHYNTLDKGVLVQSYVN